VALQHRSPEVIATNITQSARVDFATAGLKAGFDTYLTKPIKVSELMGAIEKILENSADMI
jgi:DNA-binding response OmpR family regulator